VPLSVVNGHVSEFVAHADAARPLFLVVNFHDTHFPYTHPGIETITSATRIDRAGIVPGARDALWATYTNTASNVDRAIGRVIDTIREARGREPGIVVTSDHGESLFDEGFLGHGYGLNEAQTRVPFVVANLPMDIAEPFAQSEFRPALLSALSEPDQTRAPRARPRGETPVFQYLGDLSRPRQLAFLDRGGRFIYDFRSRRARAPAGDWLPPDQLPKGEREVFLELVRFWERVQLARRDAWRGPRSDGDS
jgi:arylsulfatase A-like enzyme